MPSSYFCQQRKDLLLRYSEATREYSKLVRAVTSRKTIAGREDYLELRAFAEDARRRSEHARSQYEKHIREHGCQAG